MHWVVWCQDHDQVKEILATTQIDVDAQDDQGWTALHLACCSQYSNLWSIHQMVNRGLKTNAGHGCGLTLRPGANQRHSTLTYTYSRQSDNSNPDFASETLAFMIALDLLQAGTDVGVVSQGFCTPLHCAVNSGWIDHVDALLSFGASLHSAEFSPVRWAAQSTKTLKHTGDRRYVTDDRTCLEYLRKKLGPDAWNRIRNYGYHDGGTLPTFSWPSQPFESWYFTDLLRNTSRTCLPGAWGAVSLEEPPTTCQLCRAISIEKLSSLSGYLHAKSLHDLEHLSLKCPSCMFLLSFFESRLPITMEGDITQVILRLSKEHTSAGAIKMLRLQLSSGCFCDSRGNVSLRSLDFSTCVGRCRPILMEDLAFDVFTNEGE